MMDNAYSLGGVRILECGVDGPTLRNGGDATDVIGAAWSAKAGLVAIPLARLSEGFLVLSTGVAGDIVQKFVNYGLRLAILGDVSGACADSKALRDFVYESNRGGHVWFAADIGELEERLAQPRSPFRS